MSVKELRFSNDAHQSLLTGLNGLADAVAATMGPSGRNVLIERSYGDPLITKDGVTVAKEIEFKNKFENMGAQLVKSVASPASSDACDATDLTNCAPMFSNKICYCGLKSDGTETRY